MIPREDLFELLLAADPSFEPSWRECQAEADGDPFEYRCLNELARHVIEQIKQGDTVTLPALFDAVENLLADGEHFVREAITVGLLEDLQNSNLHETTHPNDLLPWLGPRTSQAWKDVTAFWSDGVMIPDRV